MLVSPTEPATLKTLGETSSKPEKYGVDFLFFKRKLWFGVQRKELNDFLASVQDGRLAKELMQMKQLCEALVIIEGRPQYTVDGNLMGRGYGGQQRITRTGIQGMEWSIQRKGIGVTWTSNIVETAQAIQAYEAYQSKDRHNSLDRRPGPVSVWGTPDSRDYACHVVMGIPGVGPELARRIVDRFGLPFKWRVGREQLMEIEGIGKKKAEQLWEAIEGVKEG